jgi:putative FmdB family regulatory protein
MPIYEYYCNDCGVRFEVLRSIKDADMPVACNSCQSSHTKRALSVFFAKSGSQIIAGGNTSGCAGCAGGSCSSCNSN